MGYIEVAQPISSLNFWTIYFDIEALGRQLNVNTHNNVVPRVWERSFRGDYRWGGNGNGIASLRTGEKQT